MVAGCDRMVSEVEAAVLLVHHAGKDTSAGLRGSTAVLGAMDAVLSVRRDGDRAEFTVEKVKNSSEDARHLQLIRAGDSVVPIETATVAGSIPDGVAQVLGLLDVVDEGSGVASGVWRRGVGGQPLPTVRVRQPRALQL